MAKEIETDGLPEGWCIKRDYDNLYRYGSAFDLYANGVLVAYGEDHPNDNYSRPGIQIYITSHKEAVDKVMEGYYKHKADELEKKQRWMLLDEKERTAKARDEADAAIAGLTK